MKNEMYVTAYNITDSEVLIKIGDTTWLLHRLWAGKIPIKKANEETIIKIGFKEDFPKISETKKFKLFDGMQINLFRNNERELKFEEELKVLNKAKQELD